MPIFHKHSCFVSLCCGVYFTSYLTRKCYEASMLAICDDTGLTRTAAGLGGTALVALYGSGQFATGWLADRIDPRKIVFATLLLTAACNAAMPFAVGGVAALVALNALNGIAQAMFWPPLVALLSASMHGANLMLVCELPGRFAATGRVGMVSGILNAGVYLGAAVSLFVFPALHAHFDGWKPVFGFWTLTLLVGATLLAGAHRILDGKRFPTK